MPGKLIDFDQFRAEQAKEPVVFKIGGESYNLPPTLPADIGVAVIAMQNEMGPEGLIPPSRIQGFCEAVFGEELWDRILRKHRITLEELPTVLYAVLQAYTEEDEDPKEEASPTSPTPAPSST